MRIKLWSSISLIHLRILIIRLLNLEINQDIQKKELNGSSNNLTTTQIHQDHSLTTGLVTSSTTYSFPSINNQTSGKLTENRPNTNTTLPDIILIANKFLTSQRGSNGQSFKSATFQFLQVHPTTLVLNQQRCSMFYKIGPHMKTRALREDSNDLLNTKRSLNGFSSNLTRFQYHKTTPVPSWRRCLKKKNKPKLDLDPTSAIVYLVFKMMNMYFTRSELMKFGLKR